MPITKGETNFPKNNPKLDQKKFNGLNRIEFKIPRNKKISDIIKDQTLILS